MAQSANYLTGGERIFPPPKEIVERAHIHDFDHYLEMYNRSIFHPDEFWLEQTKNLTWMKEPKTACKWDWNSDADHIRHTWFEDGALNVSANCLDRHLEAGRAQKTAIIWQGNEDEEVRTLTFQELHREVCKFANVLKNQGIKKGDRVCIYMPMIPEASVALLACARIGAIHSVVFGGFSAESLKNRINDSTCKLLITTNVSLRGTSKIPLKEIADEALAHTPSIEGTIVVKRDETACPFNPEKDLWYHEQMATASDQCPPEKMSAEDPLFILYTSGSTGQPKGVVHTQAGYLLYASMTHRYVFDMHEDDIYWCTADIGWITGHSYVIYGPLANGATTLLFEGIPTYPDPGRFWQIVEKHRVTKFYTAPTAIRAVMCTGEQWPKQYDLSSLKILGTVGEPINPEAWLWYYEHIGGTNCPIMDTWWQTETGGILITPLPGLSQLKPGSAMRPFFGVDPVILRDDGRVCESDEGGCLCIRYPWPGMMRTMWGDHDRFIQTYFKHFKDHYFTGDGCILDHDGDYWLTGRVDDVVNVSGHRIGTAEVEGALVSHPTVAEAAVVPIPHPIKGQSLYAFVTLKKDATVDSDVLKAHVKHEIGPIATPEHIQFASNLPKTRSGKIMRRILRKIAQNDLSNLGDTSTLAEPHVIDELCSGRKQ